MGREQPASASSGGLGPIWTVPNGISFVRLLCIPVFVWLLLGRENRAAAAWMLATLGATDWVDGWFARRFDQVSDLGKVLDPLADRLMLIVGIVCILIDGSAPFWFAVAALGREALVSLAALILAGLGARRIDVTWAGKAGTFFMMFAFPLWLGGHSTLSYAPVVAVLAWLFAIPGLILSYVAAAGYLPIAAEALRDGRRSAA